MSRWGAFEPQNGIQAVVGGPQARLWACLFPGSRWDQSEVVGRGLSGSCVEPASSESTVESKGVDDPHVASRSHTQASSQLRQKASFHSPEPCIITQSSPWSALLGSPGCQLLGRKALSQRKVVVGSLPLKLGASPT